MSLQLGWVDYSNADRNKVLSVLHALAAPEAVDEIGIGLIRDGFADIFFPGTSTIQTRAKYFFVVPYLLMELEDNKIKDYKKFLSELAKRELELIDFFKASDEHAPGIIGARAGKSLKRKPSSIYWSGLKTFEMFTSPYLSLEGYAKEVCRLNQQKQIFKSQGLAHEEATDDQDAIQLGNRVYWAVNRPPENWKEELSIQLTKEEAEFLKNRILMSSDTMNTLYAEMIRDTSNQIYRAENFSSIPVHILPESIRETYELARDFSEFIFGAIIRYNLILSSGQNELAVQRWEEWKNSSFVKEKFVDFNIDKVFSTLELNNLKLKNFIMEWKRAVLTKNENEMDEAVIRREISIKGTSRAKLNNPTVYAYKEGAWFGGETFLQYRFGDAKKILNDIYAALGDSKC